MSQRTSVRQLTFEMLNTAEEHILGRLGSNLLRKNLRPPGWILQMDAGMVAWLPNWQCSVDDCG